MKISLNWLKQYLDINEDIQFIESSLTDIGLEVSHVGSFSMLNENLVLGKIISSIQHPDAERLKVTQVDIGKKDPLTIVCGAPNVKIGQKVVIAPVGTVLELANGTQLNIKEAKIRGQVSQGMICAEDEIGLGTNHDTIIELDTDLDLGVPVAQYFGVQKDTIIEIDITPNRTDALSHIGVARDLAARLKKDIKYPHINEELFTKKGDAGIKVKIDDPTLCIRYSGLLIRDVTIKESPVWLQEKLKSIGQNPINNVVDITNFILQEYGQPLHAFDYDAISPDIGNSSKGNVNKTIIVKTTDPADFSCLDNKTRRLRGDEAMICDSQKPLCIAGVIGGKDSCVGPKTKNIFLESACFNPAAISKTAKNLGIGTDASYRYERGTDPNITIIALKRAAEMIAKEANGKIVYDIIDVYPQKIEKAKVKLDLNYLTSIIGQEIAKTEVMDILQRLEMQYKEDDNVLDLDIPTYRIDVKRPADVVEEILRIYGYNNIEITSDILQYEYIAPSSDTTNNNKKKNIIAELLIGKGYNEIITNSLTSSEYDKIEHSKWDFPTSINPNEYFGEKTSTSLLQEGKASIAILNPLSNITDSLRNTLLFSGLEVIAKNINRGSKHLSLFEFGKIYYKDSVMGSDIGEFNIFEEQRLGLWLTGSMERRFWIKSSHDSEFQKLNSIIYGIFHKLKIDFEVFVQDSILCFYVGDRNHLIAKISLLDSGILEEFNIQQSVVYGEINWEIIKNIMPKKVIYSPVSVFPAVSRDLSLIIDKHVLYEDVLKITETLKDPKIQQVSLVDVYEAEKLEGKKTYTINFKLRDFKKTLKEKDINKTMTSLIRAYKEQLGADIKDH